jgi:hypothetical protein
MADGGCPGPVSTADGRTSITNYITLDGAFLRTITSADGSSPATFPANTGVTINYRIDRESLATWLYLDGGLFQYPYRKMTEARLTKIYNGANDLGAINLSDRPWVTYIRWNGKEQDVDNLFSGANDAEDAVDTVFGDTPLKMTADELASYKPPDPNDPAICPHGTAVHFKFLCEVIERWYP